jgi:hypothetical protein
MINEKRLTELNTYERCLYDLRNVTRDDVEKIIDTYSIIEKGRYTYVVTNLKRINTLIDEKVLRESIKNIIKMIIDGTDNEIVDNEIKRLSEFVGENIAGCSKIEKIINKTIKKVVKRAAGSARGVDDDEFVDFIAENTAMDATEKIIDKLIPQPMFIKNGCALAGVLLEGESLSDFCEHQIRMRNIISDRVRKFNKEKKVVDSVLYGEVVNEMVDDQDEK